MGWIEYVEEILIATTTLTIVEIHRNHSEDHHPLHSCRSKRWAITDIIANTIICAIRLVRKI